MKPIIKESEKIKKKRWYRRLMVKYRLIIRDEETYEEKISIKLSRIMVFVIISSLAIFLIFITTYIIAFTPLREYIPGYTDVNLQKDLYDLHMRTDSLEQVLAFNERYLANLKLVLSGEEPENIEYQKSDTVKRQYSNITLNRNKDDSLLRQEIENQIQSYSITGTQEIIPTKKATGIKFFTPLKGIVTNEFNPVENHFGIDIVAPKNEVVSATMEGIVLFSGWTIETGHVIIIQHPQSYVSIYMHNAVLLKKGGVHVDSGEPIAIIGESGEFSTGPHLHFELWNNGNPVNPRDYMVF